MKKKTRPTDKKFELSHLWDKKKKNYLVEKKFLKLVQWIKDSKKKKVCIFILLFLMRGKITCREKNRKKRKEKKVSMGMESSILECSVVELR